MRIIFQVARRAYKCGKGGVVLRQIAASEGTTALHAAARMGKVEEVRELLSQQADPTLRNCLGHTALEHAKLNGFGGVVPQLIVQLSLTANNRQ